MKKVPETFRPGKDLDEKLEQLMEEPDLGHVYKFELRPDMPKGFKANPNYPELPAIYEFLKEYEEQTFRSPEHFQKEVLDNFLHYLTEEKIPQSTDKKLREGLMLEKMPEENSVRMTLKELYGWEYYVGTRSSTPAGFCTFGALGRIKE